MYSTQSLVNAARIRNHYVRVIDHMQCDLVIEKGKPQVYYHNQKIVNVDAIIPRIGTTATSYGVAVLRQFASQGVFSTLDAEPLLMARDKLSCLQILAGHGILVPKTIFCSNLFTLPFMLEEMEGYPVIIKLVSGTQGMGVIMAENKVNAESIIEAFHTTKEKSLFRNLFPKLRVLISGHL